MLFCGRVFRLFSCFFDTVLAFVLFFRYKRQIALEIFGNFDYWNFLEIYCIFS